MCYKGVTEEKIEKDKMSLSISFFIYRKHLAYLKIENKF